MVSYVILFFVDNISLTDIFTPNSISTQLTSDSNERFCLLRNNKFSFKLCHERNGLLNDGLRRNSVSTDSNITLLTSISFLVEIDRSKRKIFEYILGETRF